ncbi:MlaA family lipoprotein [Halomonas salifodinae]|uniref:MlaA family lipoprotein n=1 Tax=Halomonas salifodinae TaxID=438745 RepID=UPI0033B27FC4
MNGKGWRDLGSRLGKLAVVLMAVSLLAGCAGRVAVEDRHPDDPWEGFNRGVYAFNDGLDRALLRPAAVAYDTVTPDPLQRGVSNFFSNLGELRTALNSLLQGKPANAGLATGRFVINTTVGILGLVDVATQMEITADKEDFGQTLGVWGVGEGPYLVLPFFGPSTVRDTAGLPVDWVTYPTHQLNDRDLEIFLTALNLVDKRADLLDQEALIRGDRYVFIRDAYLQRRRFEVSDGELGDDPFASDDFDFDFDDDDFDFGDEASDGAGEAD